MTPSQLDTVTHVLAYALLLESVQRPGAVANVTLGEYKSQKLTKEGEMFAVRVSDHKTACSGSAVLLFDHQLKERIDNYVSLARPVIFGYGQPDDGVSQCLFVTCSGNRITQLVPRITAIGKKFEFATFSPTIIRKVASTEASKLDDTGRSSVSSLLNHSLATQQKYYELTKSIDKAAEARSLIYSSNQSSSGTNTSKPAKKKRTRFTLAETNQIEEHFQKNIENKEGVTKEECRDFLLMYPMNKPASKYEFRRSEPSDPDHCISYE